MAENLLDHRLISERYFFPRSGALAAPFWVDCGEARLACSYHEVDPAARTLVHFHGNGEIVDDWRGGFVELLHQLGVNVLLAEYRGYGRSTGRPQLGSMLADVAPTVESLGKPANELIFFGRSVGSIFAIEAVRCYPEAAGLVLESGIADVLERLLLRVEPAELGVSEAQFRQAVAAQFDHQGKLAAYPGPLLVLHSQHDGLVDVSHGERLHAWGMGQKTLKVFPRGDHNSILFENAREYFRLLGEFIQSL